ncbi:hypothetical protein AMTR_s00002p00241260 [Amborella trichopoda]|uniref:Germin-like protein n=2 Tax=Amborella trichopoda TaxID=13333 RepID=W1P2R3_AMBTC|nr:hypothetical protein AMTR_s00002p00241260 [Amborella trichopoda]
MAFRKYWPTASPLLLYLILALPPLAAFADPEPLQDFCVADLNKPGQSGNGFPCKLVSNVTVDDFVSKRLSHRGNTSNPLGSKVTAGNVLSFPGLNTLGISMNRVDLDIGGLNPPHSHPRASEMVLVVKGQILVAFVSTSNVLYSKVLGPGELFVIPRGLVHFQQNVGKGKASAVTAFNSQLPGVVLASTSLFGAQPSIPDQVLAKAFRIDRGFVKEIRSKFGS